MTSDKEETSHRRRRRTTKESVMTLEIIKGSSARVIEEDFVDGEKP
jgi:hypothetical protein